MTVDITYAHDVWQHRTRPYLLMLSAPLVIFQSFHSFLSFFYAHPHVVALPESALVLVIPCSQLFPFKGQIKRLIATWEVGRSLSRHQLLGEQEGI